MAVGGAVASVGGSLLTKENSSGGGGTGLQKVINPFAWGNKDISGKERVQRVFDPFGMFGGSSSDGGELSSIASLVNIPDFERDSLYDPTQDYLDKFSQGILGGDLPEFYSSLGKSGSQEFQDLLAMTERDVTRSVNEQYSKGGASRGGAAGQVIAESVADASNKLRYQDLLTANSEKMSLLGTGLGVQEGVRNSSLNMTNLVNQFALNKSKLELEGIKAAMGQANDEGGFLSNILGGIGSGAGLLKGIGGLFGKGDNSSSGAGVSFVSSGGSGGYDNQGIDFSGGYGGFGANDYSYVGTGSIGDFNNQGIDFGSDFNLFS